MRDQDYDYDYDEDDQEFDHGPRFPTTVLLAGIGWITYGGLGLLNMLVAVALTAAGPRVAQPVRPGAAVDPNNAGYRAGQVLGATCGGLIAGAFIFVGVQTVRGTATDTMGNSIGSLIFGGLQLVIAIGLGFVGEVLRAGILALLAGCLLGCGTLGIVGRKDYKAWRKARKRLARDIEER